MTERSVLYKYAWRKLSVSWGLLNFEEKENLVFTWKCSANYANCTVYTYGLQYRKNYCRN
jgi:hypothetical protein